MTKAFIGGQVFGPVYNTHFLCVTNKLPQTDIHAYVKAGMLLGVKMPGMTETRYKAITARLYTALTVRSTSQFVNFDKDVDAIWESLRLEAVIKIQTEWAIARADPDRALCCKRIHREWEELTQ